MAQFRQSIVGDGFGKKKKDEVVNPAPAPEKQPAPAQQPVEAPVAQTPTTAQQTQATVSQQATPVQQAVTLQRYQPSDAVLQAQALLQQQMASKPGDYSSLWQDQINQQVNQILTRDPFSYDVYADPMYRQYADQYTRMGQLASMDAMGQAAALTGGYGSSYGQSVGNQAYFNYLNQLNEVVPELYSLARNNYDQEGQAMKDRLSMLTSFENQDYSRYNDQLNQWLNERNYLTDRYETERNNDYSQFADQRNMDYQLQRDAIEDDWRQKEWDLSLQKYLASQNSGGGSSNDKKINYQKMEAGDTAYTTLMKDVERAADVDALNSVVDRYVALGYDPNVIDAFTMDAYNRLNDGNPIDLTGEYVPGKNVNNVIADVKSLGVSSESEAGKNMIRDVVLQAYNNNQLSNEDAQYLIKKYDL